MNALLEMTGWVTDVHVNFIRTCRPCIKTPVPNSNPSSKINFPLWHTAFNSDPLHGSMAMQKRGQDHGS